MEGMSKRLLVDCFRFQKAKVFFRRMFWKAEQTPGEFVELEELLIEKKWFFLGVE